MRGEDDPARAADAYGELLRAELPQAGPPRLDFALLGLGPDGHTASLFPETAALAETDRPVVANHVPKLGEWRITLTLPVLNAARRAVFLVVGEEKRDVVAAVLRSEQGSRDLPASLVRPPDGSLLWILDESAAAAI
jgi:6-phosphogluconolactonase